MNKKRFTVTFGEKDYPFFSDLKEHRDISIKEVVEKLNEFDAENRLLEIKANKFERKYIETKFKNDDLKKENKTKTELIKNLERKVKSQKQRLREMQE